ncbi:MAG: SDR family oxidoreductase [Candidatus Omnitrophica bacterium]|nr:SDR family oxidoreductase [Candidatus Omnitrophota bacterium]
MKIIIFGASGGTGLQLIEQALESGHEVTAFVRNVNKIGVQNERLHIVQGDVLDADRVKQVLKDQDAVLCALGAPAKDKSGLRAKGTKNIIDAMNAAGIKRLVCLGSLGYGDTYEKLPLLFKWIIVPFILRQAFLDHEAQEKMIKESRLDWIIARPGNLTDGPKTGQYIHGTDVMDKKIKIKISRADVAGFMLRQLTDNTYLHKTPGLSY